MKVIIDRCLPRIITDYLGKDVLLRQVKSGKQVIVIGSYLVPGMRLTEVNESTAEFQLKATEYEGKIVLQLNKKLRTIRLIESLSHMKQVGTIRIALSSVTRDKRGRIIFNTIN